MSVNATLPIRHRPLPPLEKTARVLVTGSRNWPDWASIQSALGFYWELAHLTVVHGDCPTGADYIARSWCEAMNHNSVELIGGKAVEEERYRADWHAHGKRAGFIRNELMVSLGADVCLAFIKDGSKGATHCATLAEKAGIEVVRWTL